jgi:hypothetical protein
MNMNVYLVTWKNNALVDRPWRGLLNEQPITRTSNAENCKDPALQKVPCELGIAAQT